VRRPPLFTVEESQAHRGDMPGGHAKNLFLKDRKGALWLVVAREDLRLELNRLDGRLGSARLFARPELLLEVLGVAPGSVTPLALINDRALRVGVVLDAGLMAQDPLYFHPLTNEATTRIAAADLLAFIAACGHQPASSIWRSRDGDAPGPCVGVPAAPSGNHAEVPFVPLPLAPSPCPFALAPGACPCARRRPCPAAGAGCSRRRRRPKPCRPPTAPM
jgi:Ala-tRNA(Pro) deacylase